MSVTLYEYMNFPGKKDFELNPTLKEELEKARKSGDTEDVLDVLIMEPLGMIMARLFIKLRMTPNTVTIISMFFGIVGGILLYPTDIRINLVGILLEIFAAILDCSDGQVARLTNTRSQLGRILDGVSDGICFVAIYFCLGLRLMREPIPFAGGTPWGFGIWPLVAVCGLICHQNQCRMADYYRNVHLYFLNNAYGSELSRSSAIRRELGELSDDTSALEKFFLRFYLTYTAAQEARTPKLQKLLANIEANGGVVPEEMATAYVTASRRYINLTNLLTYTLRACALYVFVLFRIPVFYFPFVIIVLGLMERAMVKNYERIAESLLPEDAV